MTCIFHGRRSTLNCYTNRIYQVGVYIYIFENICTWYIPGLYRVLGLSVLVVTENCAPKRWGVSLQHCGILVGLTLFWRVHHLLTFLVHIKQMRPKNVWQRLETCVHPAFWHAPLGSHLAFVYSSKTCFFPQPLSQVSADLLQGNNGNTFFTICQRYGSLL